MKSYRNLALALSVAFFAVPASAMAADLAGDAFSDCTCVADQVAGQPVANLIDPSGSVVYSGKNGYTPATGNVTLSDGSVVAVGTASSAAVASGTACNLSVTGNSLVSISQPNGAAGKVCIKVSELTPADFTALAGAAPAGGLGGLGGLAGLGALAAAGGLVAIIVNSNGKDPISAN